jgi:transposase InsO family protein
MHPRITCPVDILQAKSQGLPDRTQRKVRYAGQGHRGRQPAGNDLIHHSDSGSQYVRIRYTERLDQAGIKPSVGSKGDSCGRS